MKEHSHLRLEAGPVHGPMQLALLLLGLSSGRAERLTTSQGLNEHLPRLNRLHGHHEVYAGQEEDLGLDDAAVTE